MTKHELIANAIFHHGFCILDNYLQQDHYLALQTTVQSLHEQGLFCAAKIGSQSLKTHHTAIRNDHILWLDRDIGHDGIDTYLTTMDELCNTFNQTLFLGLVDYEAHFAVYPPNSFYKKHIDQFSTTKDRRISCVYYLNADWTEAFGGELILYDKNSQPMTTILPLGNRFVCFDSEFPHEVRTAYQMRYSIAAWLKIRKLSTY